MKPIGRPCLPADVVRRADDAEKRRDDALQRLQARVAERVERGREARSGAGSTSIEFDTAAIAGSERQ